MAKFGIFKLGRKRPIKIFEGECIELERGYVVVRVGEMRVETAAIIHLEPGQSIEEVSEVPAQKVRSLPKKSA
jgi:hypothetical protein